MLQPDPAPPVSHLPVVDVAVPDLPVADPGVLRARVTRVDRSAYDALAEGSGALLRVAAPRPTTDPHDAPTVGDWVDVIEGTLGWATVAVLPRTSLLVRGTASGRSAAQPLAANIDTVLVCAGLSSKLPLRRIERLLTLAWESGATPVVVLTMRICATTWTTPSARCSRTPPGSMSSRCRRRPATWRASTPTSGLG